MINITSHQQHSIKLARESLTVSELPGGFYCLQYIRKQQKPAELGLVYVIKETFCNSIFSVEKDPKYVTENYMVSTGYLLL